jgi:hypothetical protein
MAFFTARERTELGKLPQTRLGVQRRAQQQARDLVRDVFAAGGRPTDNV